jgi:amino acid transporter
MLLLTIYSSGSIPVCNWWHYPISVGTERRCGCRFYCGCFAYVLSVFKTFYFVTDFMIVISFNTKYSYWLSNGIGIVKLVTLIFISITGLVVLGGHTRVTDPGVNFRNPFEGHITPYGATTAMYRIIFSYAGYENSFNVVNEVKACSTERRTNKRSVADQYRTLSRKSRLTVLLLYFL